MRITVEVRRPARRTVALLVALLLIAAPTAALAHHQFSDVPSTHPFHAEVGAVTKAGIAGGFSDGGFHPSDPVSRQAMAAFLHRGLGRAGLSVGSPAAAASVDLAAGEVTSSDPTMVRQLSIKVPGLVGSMAPEQLVHVHGRITFRSTMDTSALGCPCEFSAYIREDSGAVSLPQFQTFQSESNQPFAYTFDVDGLFVAKSGSRSYQLMVTVNLRANGANAASFAVDGSTSVGADTFAFGRSGENSL